MRPTRHLLFILAIAILGLGTACNKFVVEDVNYSHAIESVLTPDENGVVEDVRHGISFNINPFIQQEFGEVADKTVDKVRLIRNKEGYYFITATSFKNVYVMEPKRGELKLENKIKVSDEGLISPAFNLRNAVVQLVNTETDQVVNLNAKGIQEEEQS